MEKKKPIKANDGLRRREDENLIGMNKLVKLLEGGNATTTRDQELTDRIRKEGGGF